MSVRVSGKATSKCSSVVEHYIVSQTASVLDGDYSLPPQAWYAHKLTHTADSEMNPDKFHTAHCNWLTSLIRTSRCSFPARHISEVLTVLTYTAPCPN